VRRLFFAAPIVLVASVLHAGSEDEARALFEDGNKLLEKGNYVDALEKFRAAYARWANPKILLNIGTTLRQLGRNAEAADTYAKYLADSAADPKRTAEVTQVLADLEAKIGKLEIVLAKRARVLIDGRLLGELEGTVLARVEPGVHAIAIEPSTGKATMLNVSVAAGEKRTVEITPPEAPPAEVAPPAPPVAAPAKPEAPAPPPRSTTFGAFVRTDIEVRGRGAIVAPGLTARVADLLTLSVAALVGKSRGVEPSVSVFLLRGTVRPLLLVGAPLFFVSEGTGVGFRGGAGVMIDVTSFAGLYAHASVAVFVNAPAGFERQAFIGSFGAEARF